MQIGAAALMLQCVYILIAVHVGNFCSFVAFENKIVSRFCVCNVKNSSLLTFVEEF